MCALVYNSYLRELQQEYTEGTWLAKEVAMCRKEVEVCGLSGCSRQVLGTNFAGYCSEQHYETALWEASKPVARQSVEDGQIIMKAA